jgi:hypothetical protein
MTWNFEGPLDDWRIYYYLSTTTRCGRWVVNNYTLKTRRQPRSPRKGSNLATSPVNPRTPSALRGSLRRGNPQKANRADAAQGIYRAGGPTMLFGGPGWGPYNNVVRQSLLNYDGLNEENCLFSQRSANGDNDDTQIRRAVCPTGAAHPRLELELCEDARGSI